jgi:hypothetical protein
MSENDVRDMLRGRADSITPAPDGMDRIEAKLAGDEVPSVVDARRRHPFPVLAAAAAVAVIALVGAVLVTRDDDSTSVESGPFVASPPAADELGAVWPSNDPDVLRSNSEEWATDESPVAAAKLYVEERLGIEVSDEEIGNVPEGALGVSVPTEETTVTLRRLDGDGPWYVWQSSSPNVSGLDVQHEGDQIAFSAFTGLAGDLTVVVRGASGTSDPVTTSVAAVERDTVSTVVDLAGTGLEDKTVTVAGELHAADGSVHLSELMVPAPTEGTIASGPPPGVWPWPDDVVDPAVLEDPADTARAYVDIHGSGSPSDGGFEPTDGDPTSGRVVFTGDVSTTVFVRQGDDAGWYVESAASDLVTLHDADDGTVTARVETAGELTRRTIVSGGDPIMTTVDVEGGEEHVGLGYTLGRDDAAVRELFVLETVDGTIGITDTSFRAGGESEAPDDPVSPSMEEQPGVWPMLGDDIDADVLADPELLAQEYVSATVGLTDETVFSELRESDLTSGEVEVSGDITATIVLRSVDDQWHVVTVWSPLVESRELAPGEVSLIPSVDGVLTVTALDSHGEVVSSMPASGVVAGQERLVVPDAPDGTPITVRWMLQTPMDAEPGAYEQAALGDVRLYGGAMSEPALDATNPLVVAEDFIEALVDRDVTMGDLTDHESADVQVPWDAGTVILSRDAADGEYIVVEAIGDSVQIVSAERDSDVVRGDLRLAQAGTARVSIGGEWTYVRNDVDREGTTVPFEVPSDGAADNAMLIVVFDTDTGFVSVAARSLAG